MTAPAVSLILCTVRPSHAYANHPEWDCLGKVIEGLAAQVGAPPFELVIVDGLYGSRPSRVLAHRFDVRHLPPRAGSPWVRMHKVAICAARNTGIAAARGELIVNLDDCCVLPPNFVATYWRAWTEKRTALGMIWPHLGDSRPEGYVDRPGAVYGFGSYPRALALELNGYDEAYDGAQGLEDCDWSTRLFNAGLKQALVRLPGFDIEPQTAHSPLAIDPERPIVKCCNCAWQMQRVSRQVQVANTRDLWVESSLKALVGPCKHLRGAMCGHHHFLNRCPFLEKGFATGLDPEAAVVFDEPPVLDLAALTEEYHADTGVV